MPADAPHRYLILYKPYGVLSDFADAEGRPTLADFVQVFGVQAAGQLDFDSEGLIVLTDDGDLAHRLTHPRFHLPKTYLVQVEGEPDAAALASLRAGVIVKGEKTSPAEVELLAGEPVLPPRAQPVQASAPTCWLRIVLREGRKRQVRHMTAAVGHPTLRLVRVAIGPLGLGALNPGESREMTRAELATLRKQTSGSSAPPTRTTRKPDSPPTRKKRHEQPQRAPATPRRPGRLPHGHPLSRRRGNPRDGGV